MRIALLLVLWTATASSAVSLLDHAGSIRDRGMAGAGLAFDRDPAIGWRNPASHAVGQAIGFGGSRTFDGAGAMQLIWRGGSGRGAGLLGVVGYDGGPITLNGEDGSTRTMTAERASGFLFGGTYRRGPMALGASLLQGGGSYVGIDRSFSVLNISGQARVGDIMRFAVVARDQLLSGEDWQSPGFPASLEFGVSGSDVLGIPVVNGQLSVAAAATWDRMREATSVSAGLEAAARRFAFRMGARGGSLDHRAVWTAGLGARFGRWAFDYAIELTPPEGALIPHAAGLTFQW